MKKNLAQYYCEYCKKDVPWHIHPVNHKKHLMLAALTLGMWLPIWFTLAVVKVRHCDLCDKPINEENEE
ncbi:MAG: hypothetical protein H3C30_10350 [Candidatus Hydrogenedentes bacterium]|nr:hypothetical protein [Candidatus Hydrogenedentota bacterium]